MVAVQSAEDLQWGLDVGDVVQIAQGRSEQYTYAIYCGRGRVIHVWSPCRRRFRVRVDSLRGLKASGYVATNCSRELDSFFHELVAVTPVEPNEAIRQARTALHTRTASRQSSLSFILFARYSDVIVGLLKQLKRAYILAVDGLMQGTSRLDSSHTDDSMLDLLSFLSRRSDNQVAEPTKEFFGTIGDLVLSEWLEKSLKDFFKDSRLESKWYPIPVPSAIFCTPLHVLYDSKKAVFQIQCIASPTVPGRMAGDRMQCGVCWMDFTRLKVMLLRCQHYFCDSCLRQLSKRECPYCRGSLESPQPVNATVKREARRLVKEQELLENDPSVPLLEDPEHVQPQRPTRNID